MRVYSDESKTEIEEAVKSQDIDKKLAHERYLLNSLMDNIPDNNIYFKDRESRFIRVNKALAERFGIKDPSIAIGKTDFDFFEADHARQAFEDEQRIIQTGQSLINIEEQEFWLGGKETWVLTSKVPLRNEEGEIIGTFGISRDITERKKVQKALELNNRRLSLIAEASGTIVGKDSLQTQLKKLSRHVCKAFDVDLCIIRILEGQEMVLVASEGSINADLRERIPSNMGIAKKIMKGKKAIGIADVTEDSITVALKKSGNKRIHFQSYGGAPLLIEDEVVGVIGIYSEKRTKDFNQTDLEHLQIVANNIAISVINDRFYKEIHCQKEQLAREVEERERVEKALWESEKQYREFVEETDNIVTQFDAEGRLLFLNRMAKELSGMENLQARGVSIFDYIHPEDREAASESLKQWASERSTFASYENRLVSQGGQVRYILWSFNLHYDEQGRLTVINAVGQDITERKKREEDQRNLEAQVQHAQKLESLGVLAGGIAHDFNNLLMGILGNAGLALDDLALQSQARQSIMEIEVATKRAAELTRQMLAYSGKGRFVIEAVDLNEVVSEMARLLEISISKKCILKYNFSDNLPAVEADATQLRQIIMNLITNASEAIGEKSGVICITTGMMDCDELYLTETFLDDNLKEGQYAFLEVADTGCGMTKEVKEKIFDPFFTTKFTGRGLGLAAVLGIVRGHEGALKVYSEPNKGTTFKILLPAVDTPAVPLVAPDAKYLKWKGSGKVLLVDDEETVRAVGKKMIERIGFNVLTAGDGIEAVKLFKENPEGIVCVLLDLTMPHMDGEEAFRQLRRINPKVKVILSSGYNEQEVVERFLGKGLAGFIQKPYQMLSLTQKLREALQDDE